MSQRRHIDDIAFDGRSRMVGQSRLDGAVYRTGDPSNRERVAVLLTDLMEDTSRSGLRSWVATRCPRAPDLPGVVASVLAASNEAADGIRDFCVRALLSCSPLASAIDRHGSIKAIPRRERSAAEAGLSWCDRTWIVVQERIVSFLEAVCLAWPEDVDPYSLAGTRSPRRGRVDPAPRIGFTPAGASCPYPGPAAIDMRDPLASEVAGIACWGLWRAGWPIARIVGFLRRFDADPSVEVLTEAIDVDGDGMAGAERLRELMDPPHPWQTTLRVDRERAEGVRILFCAHRQQAYGLMSMQAMGRLGAVVHGRRGPSAPGAATTGIEIQRTIAAMTRRGIRDVLVEIDESCREPGLGRFLVLSSIETNCLGIVGASPDLRTEMAAAWEDIAGSAFDDAIHDAIANAPTFGGPTIH